MKSETKDRLMKTASRDRRGVPAGKELDLEWATAETGICGFSIKGLSIIIGVT